jgi:exodeoxyribonuclease VII large subunit
VAKGKENVLGLFDVPAKKEQVQPTHTVASLTRSIKDILENTFTDVVVEGEISNFVNHRSGHRYWTLKDENAQISCTFWKSRTLSFDITDGQKVVCRGRISVYPPQGKYNLDVVTVRPLGIGALQLAYEKLYKKLETEGLFDFSRKRPIPRFPKKIGIVTSATGAALHDILSALRRRYPLVQVLLRPASVQGVGAELEIAKAIRDLNLLPIHARPDVLIVGRGGGSLEDLWCFNEEAVARAIYASSIPVISAVGHEVDVTIADFVADLRAPTPTAAAELATPDKTELLSAIAGASSSIAYVIERKLSDLRTELTSHLSGYGLRLRVKESIDSRLESISRFGRSMKADIDHKIELSGLKLMSFSSSLKALDPKEVLRRGYAIVRSPEGIVIASKDKFPSGSIVDILFQDGTVKVTRN